MQIPYGGGIGVSGGSSGGGSNSGGGGAGGGGSGGSGVGGGGNPSTVSAQSTPTSPAAVDFSAKPPSQSHAATDDAVTAGLTAPLAASTSAGQLSGGGSCGGNNVRRCKSPTARGISYPPVSPKSLKRGVAIHPATATSVNSGLKNPPLSKTRHVVSSGSFTGSEQQYQQQAIPVITGGFMHPWSDRKVSCVCSIYGGGGSELSQHA